MQGYSWIFSSRARRYLNKALLGFSKGGSVLRVMYALSSRWCEFELEVSGLFYYEELSLPVDLPHPSGRQAGRQAGRSTGI